MQMISIKLMWEKSRQQGVQKPKLFATTGEVVSKTSLSTRFTPFLSDLCHVFVIAEL
jgi:hypothetical protein